MKIDIDQYFKVLEISANSTYEEAKASYKLLVQVWHPDKHHGNEKIYTKATGKLKEINAAWSEVESYFKGGAAREAEQRAKAQRAEQERQRAEQERHRADADRRAREERDRVQRAEQETQRRREFERQAREKHENTNGTEQERKQKIENKHTLIETNPSSLALAVNEKIVNGNTPVRVRLENGVNLFQFYRDNLFVHAEEIFFNGENRIFFEINKISAKDNVDNNKEKLLICLKCLSKFKNINKYCSICRTDEFVVLQ